MRAEHSSIHHCSYSNIGSRPLQMKLGLDKIHFIVAVYGSPNRSRWDLVAIFPALCLGWVNNATTNLILIGDGIPPARL